MLILLLLRSVYDLFALENAGFSRSKRGIFDGKSIRERNSKHFRKVLSSPLKRYTLIFRGLFVSGARLCFIAFMIRIILSTHREMNPLVFVVFSSALFFVYKFLGFLNDGQLRVQI
jgi:hypothetical protein